jgi:hypothetical protein
MRQVQTLAPQLADGPVLLFVFDGGYSPSLLTAALAEVRAAILVRFREFQVLCGHRQHVGAAGVTASSETPTGAF